MKIYLNKKHLFGFLASMVIMIILGIGSFMYILNVIDSSKDSTRSQHVLLLAEEIRALMTKAEGERAQTSTNIAAKTNTRAQVSNKTTDLDSLVRKDPIQADRVRSLRRAQEQGMELDASIRIINEIKAYEQKTRKTRQASLTNEFYLFAISFSGLILAGLFIPFMLAWALNANLKERTKYVERLAQANLTIQDLYDMAPCGYFSLNREGRITHANKTLLTWLGYTATEVVDKLHIRDLLRNPETIAELDVSMLEKVLLVMNVEAEVTRKNKTILKTGINASAILDGEGTFVSSRYTVFDLTELKKVENELRRANKELEAFSYSVSHDLRAPLRSINGFAKVLMEDYAARMDETMHVYLGRIASNARLMGQLIDDLLDFARMGRKEVIMTNINLDEFVSVTYKELLAQEEGRKVSVRIHPMGDCVADQSMLKQVWINLISNALKYTGKKDAAEIEIGKLHQDEESIFFIRDNGIGFDMKSSNRLFGVFQRLHRKEDFDGTGVGLALVKRIVERHNGRIWAEARLNEGATFYFTIPQN